MWWCSDVRDVTYVMSSDQSTKQAKRFLEMFDDCFLKQCNISNEENAINQDLGMIVIVDEHQVSDVVYKPPLGEADQARLFIEYKYIINQKCDITT
jgi:hypothetical protein